jgi:hypothetical protein
MEIKILIGGKPQKHPLHAKLILIEGYQSAGWMFGGKGDTIDRRNHISFICGGKKMGNDRGRITGSFRFK